MNISYPFPPTKKKRNPFERKVWSINVAAAAAGDPAHALTWENGKKVRRVRLPTGGTMNPNSCPETGQGPAARNDSSRSACLDQHRFDGFPPDRLRSISPVVVAVRKSNFLIKVGYWKVIAPPPLRGGVVTAYFDRVG